MTKRCKRVGAFMLALAMSVSLVLSSVPALAADAAATTPDKPKLVMDFLGDNKATVGYSNGIPGTGDFPAPANHDMAKPAADPDDGTKWNRYVAGDEGNGEQTIFWIGIGIQDVDKFVLSKDGNGLYSAEVALYYNPFYVEPYDDADGEGDFKTVIEKYMLGADAHNQWGTPEYRVVQALTNQEPLRDPNDPGAQGDFTAAQYGFTKGYGTEEFKEPKMWSLWKMAYVSVEMTEEQLTSAARLSSGNDSATYYIAMVPFVLHNYDPQKDLCILLSRNASTFSIGSKLADGTGYYGDGGVTYGNWDKYTFHDPEHDLKLMLDYTGDLNIFTNEREIDYLEARLVIDNGGNSNNKAQMMLNNDPLDPPSQLADATGEKIIHLTGGEELRVSAQKMTGYTVTIKVEKPDGTLVTPVSITAVSPWTDEWTFLMPDLDELDDNFVIVTVTFDGSGINEDTKFHVDLEVFDNNYNEPNNTAKLTAPGGLTTAVLTTGTDTLSGGGAPAGTTITVSVTRNSDYDVIVTLVPSIGSAPALNLIIDQSEAQTYTFTMPAGDIKVEVKFVLKTPHKATLAVQGTVDSSVASLNYARMFYPDSGVPVQTTQDVSFANAQNSPSGVPGLDNNQIESASGRTIYIDTVCSPEYQVSNIIFRKSDDTLDTSVTATLTTTPGRYSFTMPDYEIKVIVVYERVKTYRVRLIIDTASALPGEGATLSGTDARGTVSLDLTEAQYAALVNPYTQATANLLEMFANANMGVSFFHMSGSTKIPGLGSGRTASIEIYYPEYPDTTNSDSIIYSGSAGSGYTFPMRALDHPSTDAAYTDAVYVVVHFEDYEGEDLIARIYNDRPTGVTSTNANAVWAGVGHNNPITVHENDQLTVSITVQAGYYIQSVQVYTEGPAPTYVGAPMGIPVSLSGIGYNGGLGGTETASVTMPDQNITIVVKYRRGTPPPESDFTATIRKAGNGDGDVSITNDTTGNSASALAGGAASAQVGASVGDMITATYSPDSDSYVSGVTVSANVPGTTVTWYIDANGNVIVTMPASDVVVTVTFTKFRNNEPDPDLVPNKLTIVKTEDPASGDLNNIVTATPSGGQAQVPTSGGANTDDTTAYENELVTAVVNVEAGWYIVSATAKLDSDGSVIPVTLSGNGYNGGNGGTETVVFSMPAEDATLTVNFKYDNGGNDPPDNTLTLVVTEPAGAGNSATLQLNGSTAYAGAPVSEGNVLEGTLVRVVVNAQPGYAVTLPILTTPSGLVSITWTAVDTFEFEMPGEPLTVTVPFLPEDEADNDFYADLIFRDGDGQSAAGVLAAKGTFLTSPFTIDNYANQLNGTLHYSRTAQPGEDIPFAVWIPDGYYISNITVTPANFGVEATITGMIGTQRGEFLMPAGNVRVNIYLAKGWPDEVQYRVKLHVEGPAAATQGAATLKNVTAATTISPAWRSSGSDVLTALDGEKMLVALDPGSHTLGSLEVVDGSGAPVTYHWTTYTEGGQTYLAIEFNVPGSSVDVYVKFTDEPDTNDYKVTLHLAGETSAESVTLSGASGSATTNGGNFPATAGEQIGLTVTSTASNALIIYAYAVTDDGTMVSLGDPALAGMFADAVTGAHGFVMPFHTDVDVYIGFTRATPPDPNNNEYILTLQVNGDDNSGTVTVREFDSSNTEQGSAMAATAVGGNARLAHGGNKITAEVVPAGNYALYSLIAYTSTGERVVVSLDTTDSFWRTYTFTMPENTTHIEAEFRKVEPNAYQIQVVVNNTVNGGAGNNDAFLYEPPGALTGGFKFKSGVSAGDTFDLGFIVDTGYQVASIIAVPQGSGVAANIPLPTTSSGRTQVKMPASDLVIYVIFTIDNTTRYNVTGIFEYLAPATLPLAPTSNDLTLYGTGSTQQDTLESNDVSGTGAMATIQEAQGKRVNVTWDILNDYAIVNYTVKTASGQTVLSQPNEDGTGIYFYMPAAPVEVKVILSENGVEPPPEYKYTATLHYVQGSTVLWNDQASITEAGDPSNTTSADLGVLPLSGCDLGIGDVVNIEATPGTDRYIQTIYVQTDYGQLITLNPGANLDTTNPGATSTAAFYMPSENVHVYVVFDAAQPDPTKHRAVLQVNCDSTAPHGTSSNFATMTATNSPTPASVTAYSNGNPVSMLVKENATVTVTITVDANHQIDSVIGTPISLQLVPQMSPTDPTVYTFVMPNTDTGIIVNLKERQATKYKLYLHVLNQGDGSSENDNETILEYGDPVADLLDHLGAAPKSTDPFIPWLDTPAGNSVTLTARPEVGYFVRAAYVVYQNGLVEMVPGPIPSTHTTNRSAVGLEGTTSLDIGVGDPGDKAVNMATFTMPNGNADVYVVYEKGDVPTTPWYNLVVIATDSGGTPGNAGHGRVNVSSTPAVTGGTAAIPAPGATVPSTGLATYFYSVPYRETIHLNAHDADDGYQYDTSTGMVLTYQAPTPPNPPANPDIHPVDTTNHPRGDVQEFGMPRSNVGVHINFNKAGATGLWAQLHVVQADGIPGYSANTVTMSTGTLGDFNYQSVDNHMLTAPGPTGDPSVIPGINPDTHDPTMILTSLTSGQLISALIHPRDNDTRVVQVTVSQVDGAGNVLSTSFATHAGDPTNSAQDWYNYIMGDNSVHVYVVLARKTDTDRFIAVASPVYDTGVTLTTGGTGPLQNEITGLTNTTTAGLSSAPYWTEVKASDRVKVTYTAQVGVYVDVKAYRADTGAALPDPVEFGVGNGAAGYAYVDIPNPGCDVEIQVIFSTTPPSDKTLKFISRDHDGKDNNQTELQKWDNDSSDYATLSGILVPTPGDTTDVVWPTAPATHSETPGTKLKVLIDSLESGYQVRKVEIKVGTFSIDYYMKDDPSNPGTLILVDSNDDPVDPLMMPNGDTEIIVYFKPEDDGLIPYDPNNTSSPKNYVEHWIKAENRGDYLIVTVPVLNNSDGNNPTSVTWNDDKKDRFKFYMDETPTGATTPVYTSIDYILKISRPADAPDASAFGETYWLDNFLDNYYDPDTYIGARFIVEVMTDKEIDDDASIINKTAAKTLAATLRKLMDNDGTPDHGDMHSLYISCEETTYLTDGTEEATEGEKVDFEIPRYYALTGLLESYAPTHIATFTLVDEADDTVFFTDTLAGKNGADLWQQDFKVKLTSDFEGKLKGKSFTLTIKKAGHVTYTRTAIVLDDDIATAPAGTYDDDVTFTIVDPIRLFCGDIDNNGFVEQADVQLLIAMTRGDLLSSKALTSSETGWKYSVYNPSSLAYACDLNGDGLIDIRDMNILLDGDNYGHDARDYGAPTGLTAQIAMVLQAAKLPLWYVEMIMAETAVPAWAEAMVQEQREIPAWVGELLKAEVDIPAWVVTFVTTDVTIPGWVVDLVVAGETIPEWVVTFMTIDVTIPDWAVYQVAAGKTVPEWAVALIRDGEELSAEMAELLAQGGELPEEKPEEKLAEKLEEKLEEKSAKDIPEEKKDLQEQVTTNVPGEKDAAKQPEMKAESEVKDPNATTEKTPESGSGTEIAPDADDVSKPVDSGAAGGEIADNETADGDDTIPAEDKSDNDNADAEQELPSDDETAGDGWAEESAPADGEAPDASDAEEADKDGDLNEENDSLPMTNGEESDKAESGSEADLEPESVENMADVSGAPEETLSPEGSEDILYTCEDGEFI